MTAEPRTVVHLLDRAVAERPDQAYLDFGDEVLTYGDVWERTGRVAAVLRDHGVGAGDVVAALLGNNADAVATWFATNLLGAVWVPINTGLRGEFLRHVVEDSTAPVLVVEADLVDRVEEIRPRLSRPPRIIVRSAGGPDGRPDAAALDDGDVTEAGDAWRCANPSDVAMLVYTGGTTGPSKGCMIPHEYVFHAAEAFHAQGGRRPDEVNWSALPIFHFNLVSGTIFGTLLLGGTAAVGDRFSVSGFWPEVLRTDARIVNLLGSMGWMIAQMPDTPEMRECFGQIRVVHGVPFPPELQAIWHDRFGVKIVGTQTYGCTEAFPITTLECGEDGPPGTSGRVNDDGFEVRIVDEEDADVSVGEVGEIVCRPTRPNVMFAGYWKRPEATVRAMRNLWFHTGDYGRFDEDGWFTYVDRKADYLRRRGENVSSQEMEAVFLCHPAIAAVAVHAVVSELTEDDVKVTAVLEPGATLNEDGLHAWAKQNVPDFAVPRYVEFRTELPLSPVGRVHKYLLREQGCTETTWDAEATT